MSATPPGAKPVTALEQRLADLEALVEPLVLERWGLNMNRPAAVTVWLADRQASADQKGA